MTEAFHAALESGDGNAACEQLSEEAASKLEQQEGKPCEKAILSLKIPKGGTVAVRRVELRNAYMGLAEGSADFLEEGPHGWRISAAGCEPVAADRPYECELEGWMRAMFVIYIVLITVGITYCVDARASAQLMRRFLRDNSLSIVFLALFLVALVGQAIAGHADFNEQQVAPRRPDDDRWGATSSRRSSAST